MQVGFKERFTEHKLHFGGKGVREASMRLSGLVLYFWMFLRLSDKCDALLGVT